MLRGAENGDSSPGETTWRNGLRCNHLVFPSSCCRHGHVASAEASSLSGMEQQPEVNMLKKNWRVMSLLFLLCVAVVVPEPNRTLSRALKAANLSPSVLINTAKLPNLSHQPPSYEMCWSRMRKLRGAVKEHLVIALLWNDAIIIDS